MGKTTTKSKNIVSRISADTFILPKFAKEIHNLISSNFPDTYIVGGAVRNFLLKRKVTDIDIATSATPKQVVKILEINNIEYSAIHEKLGVIVACKGKQKIEITTFRTEVYSKSRFPKVRFTKDVKKDSQRRDFTMNALYYSPQTKQVLDFHGGQKDINKKLIKLIGRPDVRIQEDPLRILRAYRFALQYKLNFDTETSEAIQKNLHLLKKVSSKRLQKEISVVKQKSLQKTLQKVIHSST